MTPTADLAHDYANLVANTRYEHLSPAAVDAAKKSVLDTLGIKKGDALYVRPKQTRVFE